MVLIVVVVAHEDGVFPTKHNQNMIAFLGKLFSLDTWNHTQHLLNAIFTNGAWVDAYNTPGYQPLYTAPCVFEHPNILRYVAADCLSSNANKGNWYSWIPDNGKVLENWDSSTMCQFMQGRTILLAGDSLQSQFYFSFVATALSSTEKLNLSTVTIVQNIEKCRNLCEWTPHGSCERPITIDCGNQLPPYYILYSRTNFLDTYINTKDSTRWLELIDIYNVSLLFINTGAHYQSDESLLQNINNSMQLLFHRPHQSVSVIYRNTFHGHDHCDRFISSSPLSRGAHYHLMDEQLRNHPNYGWQHFDRQNHIVQEFLRVYFPQVVYLDIATSTNLRIDSHVSKEDCYHYCLPGPVDTWVLFHYNVLYRLWLLPQQSSPVSIDTTAQGSAPPLLATSISPSPPFSSILALALQDGDIITGEPFELYGDIIPMVAHFLYYNGTKRYIAPGDVSLFLQLLHNSNDNDHNNDNSSASANDSNNITGTTSTSTTSASIIHTIPQSLLHTIPTVQWHVTIDHMESITSP